jgi:hypothetical protein
MTAYGFEKGDRVVISDTPIDASDRAYSGRVGTVNGKEHRNSDRDVYRVMLDDGSDYGSLFYDQDLIPYSELTELQTQLVKAEAEVVRLKKAIKLREQDASTFPVATVVAYKDVFGPAAITKQAENLWLNVFPTQSGNVNTETVTDYQVTGVLSTKPGASVRKP